MKRTLIPIAVALVLGACGNSPPPGFQGYVEGEYVRVAAPFAGTLVSLDTQRGAAVAAGAALFSLEAESEDAARREALERQRKAAAQVEDLKKGRRPSEVESARAQLSQAQVSAAYSAQEWRRQPHLASKGFVSQSRADEAKSQRDRDHDKVVELQNALATVEAGSRPDEIRAAEAEAAAAGPALAQADWGLAPKTLAAAGRRTVLDPPLLPGE